MMKINCYHPISMRIAYLECFSGMSGDMFLGALVDAGVAPQTLEDTVAALNVGARLEISRVLRSGISATKVDVWVNGQKDLPREEYWERKEHEHSHDDQHEHEGHAHSHSLHGEVSRAEPALSLSKGVPAPHEHSHSHGRGLTEIRQIISAASISESAKKTAIAIFEALGQDNSPAKVRNLISAAHEASNLLEKGELEERVRPITSACSVRQVRARPALQR